MGMDGMKNAALATALTAWLSTWVAAEKWVSWSEWSQQNPDAAAQIAQDQNAIKQNTARQVHQLADSSGQVWHVADNSTNTQAHNSDWVFQIQPSNNGISANMTSDNGLIEVWMEVSKNDQYAIFMKAINRSGTAGISINASSSPILQKLALTLGFIVGKDGMINTTIKQLRKKDMEFAWSGGTFTTDLDKTVFELSYDQAIEHIFFKEFGVSVAGAELHDKDLGLLDANTRWYIHGGHSSTSSAHLAVEAWDGSRWDIHAWESDTGISLSQDISKHWRANAAYTDYKGGHEASIWVEAKYGDLRLSADVLKEAKEVRLWVSYVWGWANKKGLNPLFSEKNDEGRRVLNGNDLNEKNEQWSEREWNPIFVEEKINTPVLESVTNVSSVMWTNTVTAGQSTTLRVTATDTDSGISSVTATINGANVTVVQSWSTYSIVSSNALAVGSYPVVFTVIGTLADGSADSANPVTQTTTLDVQTAPDTTAPVGQSRTVNAWFGDTASISVTISDNTDPSPTIVNISTPAQGAVNLVWNTFNYEVTDGSAYGWPDSFTYQVRDASGNLSPVYTINIDDIADT